MCTMMNWLATLPYHNYEVLPPGSGREPNAVLEAHRLLTEQSAVVTSRQERSNSDLDNNVRHALQLYRLQHVTTCK